jgi:ATP-dependent DNA helicase RecG
MTENKLLPSTPIQYLKGVGPNLALRFKKKHIISAWDMLFNIPMRYLDRRKLSQINALKIGEEQSFTATIQSYHASSLNRGRRKLMEVLVQDDQDQLKLTFFQFNEKWLKQKFPVGSKVLIFGEVRLWRGIKNVVHPEMEPWDDEDLTSRIVPLYSLTEGLYQKTVRSIMTKNLERLLELVEDDSRTVREEGAVQVSLKEAFRYIHAPPVDADLDALNNTRSPYHQRIVYDEFFFLQLGLRIRRCQQAAKTSFVLNHNDRLLHEALSQVPFELTGDQKKSLEEIGHDFRLGKPMNRMMQGDVGSGKTIVAFLSALSIIQEGYQVAMMAPTEILAEQHYRNLTKQGEPLGITVKLLTGSTKAKERKIILEELITGKIDLLIGTHALITPDVLFKELGYVIIDEQHRFGVLQRAQLKNKSHLGIRDSAPHLLIMTATPIPRSLSMCVYGDLDISIIKEMPKGRKPIMTKVYREADHDGMCQEIAKELEQGRQAYFVYPLVEESEKMDLKDATLMHKKLSTVFKKFNVGLLHGRMKGKEKDAIMQQFKNKELHVLVSTTVVEVGVDVPNSTVMVVEHAERFGLSQLHQLRGRVGRGADQSYCYLVAQYAQSEESRFRLKTMERTNDGFVIAEEDLKLRGPGEFLGTRQSGMPDFRIAHIVRDGNLLKASQKRAEEILSEDPDLSLDKNLMIKKIMIDRWGEQLELSSV